MKQKQTVVLGVASGIAAYKTIELVQLLKKDKFEVFVIMTQNAARMIPPKEFEKALGTDSGQARMTKKRVYIELFEKDFDYKNILKKRKVDHIDLADKADIFVIAPATANTIAKIAHGLADDFLTTGILATQAPILICPSMNVHMWENEVVQSNVQLLQKRGMHILDPEEGDLACGYRGKGRLAHIYHIRDEISSILQKTEPASQRGEQLKGKRVLVTAGATIEKIDDVRFIANKSSGKMGIAIAQECFARGADVLLFRSSTSVKPSVIVQEKEFEGIDELEGLMNKYISSYDIIFHTAAVSDFQIANSDKGKAISNKSKTLKIVPAKKLINSIKKRNPKIKLIAFKAEWGLSEKDVQLIAKAKIKDSNADAIIINDVSKKDRGFEVDTNEVFVVTKKGLMRKIPLASKQEIAKGIIDFLF